MSEKTYTLREAAREIAREACRKSGHDFEFRPRLMRDEAPPGIVCARCGWSGVIVMDDRRAVQALVAEVVADAEAEDFCHCGEPVRFGYDGDPMHTRGMCAHCDSVRCDAHLGECGR